MSNGNGRNEGGEEVDPCEGEKLGLLREVGRQAMWSLSSCKPGIYTQPNGRLV